MLCYGRSEAVRSSRDLMHTAGAYWRLSLVTGGATQPQAFLAVCKHYLYEPEVQHLVRKGLLNLNRHFLVVTLTTLKLNGHYSPCIHKQSHGAHTKLKDELGIDAMGFLLSTSSLLAQASTLCSPVQPLLLSRRNSCYGLQNL